MVIWVINLGQYTPAVLFLLLGLAGKSASPDERLIAKCAKDSLHYAGAGVEATQKLCPPGQGK